MADQGTEGLLSPWLRRRRLSAARPHLQGRVLDVGCGSGALAAEVAPDRYRGIDIDPTSLQLARHRYPDHQFASKLAPEDRDFDAIVALAVIEHIHDPIPWLLDLGKRLRASSEARLVLTTPHPALGWVHTCGAAMGLFSRHASEEHESLLGRTALVELAARAGLTLTVYRRFMAGANQLAVLKPIAR